MERSHEPCSNDRGWADWRRPAERGCRRTRSEDLLALGARAYTLGTRSAEAPMRCRACRARLSYEDNYCRKCGAAVDVYDVEVVQTGPARQVTALRQAAIPVVARGTA